MQNLELTVEIVKESGFCERTMRVKLNGQYVYQHIAPDKLLLDKSFLDLLFKQAQRYITSLVQKDTLPEESIKWLENK